MMVDEWQTWPMRLEFDLDGACWVGTDFFLPYGNRKPMATTDPEDAFAGVRVDGNIHLPHMSPARHSIPSATGHHVGALGRQGAWCQPNRKLGQHGPEDADADRSTDRSAEFGQLAWGGGNGRELGHVGHVA